MKRSAWFPVSLCLLCSLCLGVLVVAPDRAVALAFGPKTDYAAGQNDYSLAVGDFNGDGVKDLVTANADAPSSVSVLLGNLGGGFSAKTDFATGSGPLSVAVGDFNGDGKQDLVTANESDNTVSVLLGNGSGGFGAKTDFGAGAVPSGVAVGDFNGDGKADLAVTDYVANTVSVLLGDGSGGFFAPVAFATGSGPLSVAVGDFNGDGKADLAVADYDANTVSVLLGKGSEGFSAKTDYATGSGPLSVAVGDFNGDGVKDLVTANADAPSSVSVLLGNGSGGFGAKTDFGAGSGSRSVAVSDFNGDAIQDLAVANSNANTVSVLLGDGSGGFSAKTDYATGVRPCAVAVGDFNADGKQDLATANWNTVSVLLNSGFFPLSGTMTVNGAAAWTGSTTVTVSSSVVGASEMRFRDLDGVWSSWRSYSETDAWTMPPGDGAHTIQAQYRNGGGYLLLLSDVIALDTTAPATTDNAPVGWQTVSSIPVMLTPNDGGGSGMSGGLAKTQYKLDGASSWSTGTTVPVSGDGIHIVRYRSIDAVGNREDTEICTVKIDTTAPLTTQTGADSAWHHYPVTVVFSASDATSPSTRARALNRATLERVAVISTSMRSWSPGRTGLRKRALSMAMKYGIRSDVPQTRLMRMPAVCAMASSCRTPGITGEPGKCP